MAERVGRIILFTIWGGKVKIVYITLLAGRLEAGQMSDGLLVSLFSQEKIRSNKSEEMGVAIRGWRTVENWGWRWKGAPHTAGVPLVKDNLDWASCHCCVAVNSCVWLEDRKVEFLSGVRGVEDGRHTVLKHACKAMMKRSQCRI